MLSPADARALVEASRLFDERWYAALAGRELGSRSEAVAHWVDQLAPHAAPHPLFEPAWLYPGGRWREHAPDPLSFYLARPGARGRSPHPSYPLGRLGPLEDWLEAHDPAELLADPLPRAPRGGVTVVAGADPLARAVAWARHAERLDADLLLRLPAADGPTTVASRRVLETFLAARPRARVVGPDDPGEPGPGPTREPTGEPTGVVVRVDDEVDPPGWPWLPPLLDLLAEPGVEAAQPVLVGPDVTLNGPLLPGHPVSAVDPLDGVSLPGPFAGVTASRSPARETTAPGGGVGASRGRVLCARSWVPGPQQVPDGPGWAGLERRARSVEPVEGVPSLRWALDIAAGAAPIGRRWGDWHFASSLAQALRRLGQWVEIDHPETRGRATRQESDVVLTLRGLEPVAPQPGATNLLWVISHPAEVTAAELSATDRAFAASTTWAARHGVEPLLQCTDATRFHPGAGPAGGAAPDPRPLVVANARGGMRPAVAAARAAGVPVRLIGTGWSELGVEAEADAIANADLPAAYASAPVVLADHHDDMRAAGFCANRVLDVLAVGGRLLVDDVAGLEEIAGPEGAVVVWRTPDDVARLTRPPYDAWPDAAAREATARRVVAEHSFDARARTLLDAALDCRG